MQPLVPLVFHNLPSPSFRRRFFILVYLKKKKKMMTKIRISHMSDFSCGAVPMANERSVTVSDICGVLALR